MVSTAVRPGAISLFHSYGVTFFFRPISKTLRLFLNRPTMRSPLARLISPSSVQHFGIRERWLAIGGEQAVHVIGVEMRDHDHVDFARIEARSLHVLQEQAVVALAGGFRRRAGAGVEHDQLAAALN